jgi:hypothetical protein
MVTTERELRPTAERRAGAWRWRGRPTPGKALALTLLCFAALATAVLVLTPPWEANDEPDHVQNVERIVSGHWYGITRGSGIESHQAPLYYVLLAAYQKLVGVPLTTFNEGFGDTGTTASPDPHGLFDHKVAVDGTDQRQVDALRLPSVLLGLLTIVFTFLAARFVTRDRWTPVVAAAIVAAVPRFVFLSGVINNDNLSNALGGAALVAALGLLYRPPRTPRARIAAAAGVGLLAGALVLTKLTAALVVPGLLVAVVVVSADRGEMARLSAAFAGAAFLVCGWWLIQNQVRYGDPLAASATTAHFRQSFPALLQVGNPFKRIFWEIPRDLYKTFWYSSGWNQFEWRWFWYLPFWALVAVGVAGLAWRGKARERFAPAGALTVCSLVAVGALLIVWVLGLQTNTQQGRLAFVGLPAIGVLLAVGYERLGLALRWRFALPVIGLIGTILAIRYDVVGSYLI